MLRIVIWKDVLEVISTEIWFNNQNTLIHIDSSGFLYVILAWYAMKKCMHKIENIPLQPSSFYSWGGGGGGGGLAQLELTDALQTASVCIKPLVHSLIVQGT